MDEELNISPNDFIIQISPVFSDGNEWSGDVSVSVIHSDENELDIEDFETLYSFTKFLCSLIPFLTGSMEDSSNKYLDSVRETLHNKFDEDNVVKLNFTKNGNVIHADFKKKED